MSLFFFGAEIANRGFEDMSEPSEDSVPGRKPPHTAISHEAEGVQATSKKRQGMCAAPMYLYVSANLC